MSQNRDREGLADLFAGCGGLDHAEVVELACSDMIARWRGGLRPLSEDYLNLHPALNHGSPGAFELIYGEFALRLNLGEPASIDSFSGRFPGHAGPLREQVDLDQALDSIGPDPAHTQFAIGSTDDGTPGPAGSGAWPDLAGYRIECVLGRGGMGVVYKARESRLDRTVAIKTIAGPDPSAPGATARFLSEALAIARVVHPNVVAIHSIGDSDEGPFLVMEYVEGGNLAARLDGTPLPAREASALLEQVARGVHEAHTLGVVHRDLKPANILISADGTPKVADFGLAKLMASDSGLTRTDSILGSPSYMAPEQAESKNREVGPAADTYALGAILYEMLTGRPPFRAATILQTLESVRSDEPVPPSRLVPSVPRDIETICLKCLAKDPAKRYASANALAEDLGRFGDGRAILARRVSPVEKVWRWAKRHPDAAIPSVAFALALVAGVVGVVWKWRDAESQRYSAEVLSAGLTLDRADDIARRGEPAEAAFWMVKALRGMPANASDLDAAARRDLSAWLAQAPALEWAAEVGRPIRTAAIHPDGRSILVGDELGHVLKLGDGDAKGETLATIAAGSPVQGLAYRPDGRAFAAAHGGVIRLRDAATGEPIGEPMPHPGDRMTARFSRDGSMIATASLGRDVRIWSGSTGDPIGPPIVHESPAMQPMSVAISPTGRHLAIGYASRGRVDLPAFARVFDVATRAPAGPILPHGGGVYDVAFSPDGESLATACHDRRARIWTLRDGKIHIKIEHPLLVALVDFTPDGQTIITACYDGRARTWDVATGREGAGLPRHEVGLAAAAVDSGGRRLLVASTDGVARLWTLPPSLLPAPGGVAAARPARPLPLGDLAVPAAFSPDRRTVVVGGRDSGLARMVGTEAGEPIGPPLRHRWPNVLAVAFSPDGSRIATAGQDSATVGASVALRDARTGKVVAWLPNSNWIRSIVFSPDGKLVATGGFSGMVRLWEAETGQPVGLAMKQGAIVRALAFDPASTHLIVATEAGNGRGAGVRTWTIPSCVAEGEFRPDGQLLATSPDGRTLVVFANDRVQLLDRASGRAIGGSLGRGFGEMVAEFSPDGRFVAAGARDGSIRVWDARDGTALGTTLRAGESVAALAFSDDGRTIASGGERGAVQIWDLNTYRSIGPAVGHRARVLGVAFRPGGRSFASVAIDGDARGWAVPEPIQGTPDELGQRLQATTGLEMLRSQVVEPLAPSTWQDRKERAHAGPSISLKEDPARWNDFRARDATQAGDTEAALWHLDRLAVFRPDDWTIPARRSWVLALAGRAESARAERVRALAAGSAEVVADWSLQRAADLAQMHRPEDARTFAENAQIQADPDDSEAILEQAARLADSGEWAKSAELYAKASKLTSLPLQDRTQRAIASLAAGDRRGYRAAALGFVEWAVAAPDEPAAITESGWAAALGPSALDDYAPWLAAAKNLLENLPPGREASGSQLSGAIGAILYRAGRSAEASAYLDQGPSRPDQQHFGASAALKAMAKGYAKGLPTPRDIVTNNPTWERQEARMLLDEAARKGSADR